MGGVISKGASAGARAGTSVKNVAVSAGTKVGNVFRGGTAAENKAAGDARSGALKAKKEAGEELTTVEQHALKMEDLRIKPAGEMSAANRADLAAYTARMQTLGQKAKSVLGSNAGVMWGSSIAGGLLMMTPWFASMANKKKAADPAGAGEDMFGLAGMLGPELAAIAPMLIAGLPVCLCCCCFFCMMMMMMMSAGGGSSNN